MSEVVTYYVDELTTVQFEIEPPPGFQPAGPGEIVGKVRESLDPAVKAAREVLERVKDTCPDEVQVKFGIKVSGTMNWLVAKAATEGNFEVTLTWKQGDANALAGTALSESGA
ncbi:CU044_2847 family protein [Microbispora sp. ATCC PTA-5024]|uniref:CU044_2847 family protein n=1 Tax=Microbispora sp. ATCC PTA-5024 TaxID=316330 RepID=UPI000412FFC0|nr:CU044_2847 family protein [Microbispora sp. ATCC PTA-5024]